MTLSKLRAIAEEQAARAAEHQKASENDYKSVYDSCYHLGLAEAYAASAHQLADLATEMETTK